jgi:hypothetical protein
MKHGKGIDKHYEAVSRYLIPDLARLSIDYLARKEVPLRKIKLTSSDIFPKMMAVSPNGQELFVADNEQDRIEVFSSEGKFLRQWKIDGGYNMRILASFVAVDHRRFYYVDLAYKSLRIYSTVEGKLLQKKQDFSGPMLVHDGEIYTADLTGRIRVFTPEFKLLRSWTIERRFLAFAISPQHEIFILTIGGNFLPLDDKEKDIPYLVQVFNLKGDLLRSWIPDFARDYSLFRKILFIDHHVYFVNERKILIHTPQGEFVREWSPLDGLDEDDHIQDVVFHDSEIYVLASPDYIQVFNVDYE